MLYAQLAQVPILSAEKACFEQLSWRDLHHRRHFVRWLEPATFHLFQLETAVERRHFLTTGWKTALASLPAATVDMSLVKTNGRTLGCLGAVAARLRQGRASLAQEAFSTRVSHDCLALLPMRGKLPSWLTSMSTLRFGPVQCGGRNTPLVPWKRTQQGTNPRT